MFIFTKQQNSLLYSSFIFNTLSSKLIQFLLISLEFLFGLYPSLSTIVPKIYNYSSEYSLSPFEKKFCLFSKPKQLLIKADNYLSLPLYYYLPIISLIVLSLIGLTSLNIFYSKKANFTFIDKIIVNYYNLFFFRYFNYLLLDPLFYICLHLLFSFNQKGTINLLCALLCLVVICIYIVNTFFFIKNFSLYLKITNTFILTSEREYTHHINGGKVGYPFLKFSAKYEIYILVIKILVIIESNLFILSKNKVTKIIFTLNLFILIIHGIVAFDILSEGKKNNIDLFAYCWNKINNSLRKIIMLFSCIFQGLNIWFYKNDGVMEIKIFVFSLIFSIGIWYFQSQSILINALSGNLTSNIKDIVLYLLCMELPKDYNVEYNQRKGLFAKKLVNSSDKMWILLYNAVLIDHLYNCKDGINNCKACKLLNNNLNTQYNGYDILYNIFLSKRDNLLVNSNETQKNFSSNSINLDYRDFIIKMLYNKIKGNSYEFFKGFISLMWQVSHNNFYLPTFIKNSLMFLIDYSTYNEKKHRCVLLKLLTNISDYEDRLRLILSKFREFIGEDISSKRADTALSIATKLVKLRDELSSMISQFEQTNTIEYKTKNKEVSHEENMKIRSLQGTSKYALVIQRFIIEIFTNQPFTELHLLNIEMMDDFLDFHFNSDTLMILFLKQSGQCTIITSSGLLENKDDSDITCSFPPQFQAEGTELLQKSVNTYKTGINQNKYQFIIKHNEFIKYFNYNYEISNMLLEQNILLFGHFNTSLDKIMLLRHHHSTYKDITNMLVINFSVAMGRLIKLRPSIINVIYQFNQVKLQLSDLFTDFISLNKQGKNTSNDPHVFSFQNKYNNKISTKEETSFQCELDYYHLNSTITQYLKSINLSSKTNEIFLEEEEGSIPLSFAIPKIKKILNAKALSNLYYILTFTKLFDINESHTLYKITITPEPEYNINEKDIELFPELSSVNNRTNSIQLTNNELLIYNKLEQMQVASNSSVCVSLKENSSATNFVKQKTIQKYCFTEILIQKEANTYKQVSYSARILKILLIPLLVIFLIIQISNTNEIRNVNNIYIKYNSLVCDFSNALGSLLSLICIADINSSFHNESCQNYMSYYLRDYQMNIINFTDFTIIDYLLKENLFKVFYLSDNYGELVQLVYELNDKAFLKIFDAEVFEMILHDEGNGFIDQTITYETFDTSIKNFLSSLMVIYSKEEEGARFYDIPIYFLTFYERRLNFDILPEKHLSPIQKEIYQLMVNYVFFIVNFMDGETQLRDKIFALRKTNIVITWVFIIIVIVLNVLLSGLNCLKIKSSNELFRKIILSILLQMEDENTKEYLSTKIDNLLTILELYYKKPSNIISSILKNQTQFNSDQHKKYKLKENEMKYSPHVDSNTKDEDSIKPNTGFNLMNNPYDNHLDKDEQYILSQLTNNSYSLKPFYTTNITPLYIKNVIFNSVHIVIIVIADIILITFYGKVFKYFEYVEINLSFVVALYNGLSVSYLHRLLNLTDNDFASIVKRPFSEDGLVNVYFRLAFNDYTKGNHLQREGNFKPLTDFITPTCSEFYRELEDKIIDNYVQTYKVNADSVFQLFEKICNDFLFMTFGNLNWSVEEYSFLIIDLNNKFKENDIESLMKFAQHNTLHKAYMHFYFYIRPCMSFFIRSVLTPSILEDFYIYLIIVWVYLFVNLLLEIILFILLNCFVEKKLHTIKTNLFLFENTLF